MNPQNPEFIDRTWFEAGYRARPLGKKVFFRTDLRPEYECGIYIPPAYRTNYADLPHRVVMTGTVLSVGPQCVSVKPGDRIGFSRLYMGWLQRFDDGTLLAFIEEENLFGFVEEKAESP